MEDMIYTARLVVSDGYQDRLDMSITCENAQQLLRARNTISDQLNTYIAEFAIQSGLNAMPAKDPNGEALQEVIEESVEKAKAAAEETEDQEETPEEVQTAEDPDDGDGEDAAEEPQIEESAPAPEPPPPRSGKAEVPEATSPGRHKRAAEAAVPRLRRKFHRISQRAACHMGLQGLRPRYPADQHRTVRVRLPHLRQAHFRTDEHRGR